MIDGDGIRRLVAQRAANLVEHELGCVLELQVSQPESRIEHLGQDRQEALLLLGHDVGPGRLAEQCRQVAQACRQIGLGLLDLLAVPGCRLGRGQGCRRLVVLRSDAKQGLHGRQLLTHGLERGLLCVQALAA
jgi:hypothetical protein